MATSVTINLGDLPGWLQAIGGLAGIAAAYFIARIQGKNQLKLAQIETTARLRASLDDRHRFLSAVRATAYAGYSLIKGIGDQSTDSMHREAFDRLYRPEAFDAALRGIRAIPTHELGDLDLVIALSTLEGIIVRTKSELDARNVTAQTDHEQKVRQLGFMHEQRTLAFNAAASVTRRIVELGVPELPNGPLTP